METSSTVNSGDGAFIAVERKNDATQTGFVSVTNADGKTTIGIIVGKNLSGTPNAAPDRERQQQRIFGRQPDREQQCEQRRRRSESERLFRCRTK